MPTVDKPTISMGIDLMIGQARLPVGDEVVSLTVLPEPPEMEKAEVGKTTHVHYHHLVHLITYVTI